MGRCLFLLTLILFTACLIAAQQPSQQPSQQPPARRSTQSGARPEQKQAEKKPGSSTEESKKRISVEEQRFLEQLKREEEERLRQERLQMEMLVSYARVVPPEFQADALLRIVESGKIVDPRGKIELLEEAFRKASETQYAVKKYALSGSTAETRSGSLSSALALGLDRLSLQCRAIRGLLALDKLKARRLFTEISGLKLELLTCEDALVYDVDVFYETAAKVLTSVYSPVEMRRNQHIEQARRIISRLTSPAQIEPASRLIVSLNPTPAQLESLVREYCSALGNISGDSRSFFVGFIAPIAAVERLVKACQQKGISCAELIEELRGYLVNNLTGNRCADSYRPDPQMEVARRVIRPLFEDLKSYSCRGEKEILPLANADFRPAKIEGSISYVTYWRSAKSRAIRTRIDRLRWKSPGRLFTDDDKLEADWQFRFSQLLTEMGLWSEDDEKSEADYFHQKCLVFYSLYELAPEGKSKERILYEFIIFLSTSRLQRSAPVEWFQHANRLFYLARISEPEERLWLLDALKQSNNPILYLYAEMDTALRTRR